MSRRDEEHQDRLKTSYANWLRRRAILEPYRVGPEDRRTTPQPAFDVGALFPELAGQSTITIRLHPRYGEEPPVSASKMGGTFLWPADEPWPSCPAHEIPLVAVLQLSARDLPEMPFPPGADLFQVLWCPREHDGIAGRYPDMYWADPRFYWRNRDEIAHPRPDNPPSHDAFYEYVPLPCRLIPERVIEYPSVYDLPEDFVQRIYDWENKYLGADGMHVCEYESGLSVAYGTKVGGFLHWIQSPWIPTCNCGAAMEHLLTIATVEWNGIIDQRWTPIEEQKILRSFPGSWDEFSDAQKAISGAFWIPTGINLGDGGHMQLFVCRNCPDWPIVPAIECC